jgi:hypothetical protein
MPRPDCIPQRDVSVTQKPLKTTDAINEDREKVGGRYWTTLNRFSYFVEVRLQSLNLAGKRILKLVG